MENIDLLRKLFDEKIILTLNMFLDNPQEKFSLTQISANSGINNATTIRIINKLISQNILELTRMGKSKAYGLKQSQKTLLLTLMIKKEEQISEFMEMSTNLKGIEKILLDSRDKTGAKFIFITSSNKKDELNALCKKIQTKYNYQIKFIEFSISQFQEMENFGFQLSKKIVWDKDNLNESLTN
ncbi:MAG TPA: hypothetical protein VHA12_04070 [Candidatus Nanoarchaeia archaeon]|nr:hypothetical protein [Candidatus Nanoarchaeia archaeon]